MSVENNLVQSLSSVIIEHLSENLADEISAKLVGIPQENHKSTISSYLALKLNGLQKSKASPAFNAPSFNRESLAPIAATRTPAAPRSSKAVAADPGIPSGSVCCALKGDGSGCKLVAKKICDSKYYCGVHARKASKETTVNTAAVPSLGKSDGNVQAPIETPSKASTSAGDFDNFLSGLLPM